MCKFGFSMECYFLIMGYCWLLLFPPPESVEEKRRKEGTHIESKNTRVSSVAGYPLLCDTESAVGSWVLLCLDAFFEVRLVAQEIKMLFVTR